MALNPTVVWLLVGIVLCLIEFILPTAFIASVMGISAFIVAPIASRMPLSFQILLWMALSLSLVLLSRRFIRKPTVTQMDAIEAETLTEILPGKSGRVLYEGNSWAARCEDHTLAIASQQKVYVVGRQGTTLLVMPESLVNS